jgi:rubrerythrin
MKQLATTKTNRNKRLDWGMANAHWKLKNNSIMEKNKKSKVAEFFENVGFGIGIIWMLICLLPLLVYEGIVELLEKWRKAKEPKPDAIKFICSECGETFTVEKTEKEWQVRGNDGKEHIYLKPTECPECHGMRTYPKGEDISLYEKIWDMDELSTFFWDMEQDWLQTGTTVDHGLINYRCSECGTVFKARDIGHYRTQHPFPSRCPHCHHTKTLPTSETDQKVYEPVWKMLELAEQTKKAREMKKALKIITLDNGF